MQQDIVFTDAKSNRLGDVESKRVIVNKEFYKKQRLSFFHQILSNVVSVMFHFIALTLLVRPVLRMRDVYPGFRGQKKAPDSGSATLN